MEGAIAQLAAAERARDAETRAAADDIAAMKRELEQQKADLELAAKAEMLRLQEEAHELERQRAKVKARELQLENERDAVTKQKAAAGKKDAEQAAPGEQAHGKAAGSLAEAEHKAASTKSLPTAVLAVYNASPDADGYYREDGTENSKPRYIKINADGSDFTSPSGKTFHIAFVACLVGAPSWRIIAFVK